MMLNEAVKHALKADRLLFPPPRPRRETDGSKCQPGHRGAPGEKIQKEGGFQYLNDH